MKTIFIGIVKHKDVVLDKDESPKSKENAFYIAYMIDLRRSFKKFLRKKEKRKWWKNSMNLLKT